jgi:hypothetical protein
VFYHFNIWMWLGLMKEDNTMPAVTGREVESDRALSNADCD